MASILRPGQTLRGRVSAYSLTEELYKAADSGIVFLARKSGNRFSTVQLGDCGGVVPEDSNFARDGHPIALKRIYKFFGPFPQFYDDFNNPDVIGVVDFLNRQGPREKPFHLVTTKEAPATDKKFILKIMKLDPRDRPTVEQLLADEWFIEESDDTRVPLEPKFTTPTQ
ncbi:hypothetical protein O1611_g563 [Lasiodiplodia mahajangana]|uniref:Uncharacterized protein n=1 Tax=Lasiodiplodia mahajangana TaxID=1108764 RepID=A0ACC2K0A2_9PEZI|nr:hypothetical protein O1611_g563 [Lasiodiplodia mahajangana]